MKDSCTSFKVMYYGKRRLFAFPVNLPYKHRLSALSLYRADTWAKKIVKYGNLCTLALFIDRLIWKSENKPLAVNKFPLDKWVLHVENVLRVKSLMPMIIWPPQIDRNRVYVFLLNTHGYLCGYAKISFDEYNNGCLKNESFALEYLKHSGERNFLSPEQILYGNFEQHSFLIVKPFPDKICFLKKNFSNFPQECVENYAGDCHSLTGRKLKKTAWWGCYEKNNPGSNSFNNQLEKILRKENVDVCNVHGDLGPANIIIKENMYYIFDWENFSRQGPKYTDLISFWLGINQKFILNRPQAGRKCLLNYFLEQQNIAQKDIMTALAFLCAKGSMEASAVISVWD